MRFWEWWRVRGVLVVIARIVSFTLNKMLSVDSGMICFANSRQYAEISPDFANIFTKRGVDYCFRQIQTQSCALPLRTLLSGTEGAPLPATGTDWTKDRFGDNNLDLITAGSAPEGDIWGHAFLAAE